MSYQGSMGPIERIGSFSKTIFFTNLALWATDSSFNHYVVYPREGREAAQKAAAEAELAKVST